MDSTKESLFHIASYYEDNKNELRELFETLEYEDLIDFFKSEKELSNIESQILYHLIEENYKKRISLMFQRNERIL